MLCFTKKRKGKEFNKNHPKENTNLSTLITISNLNKTTLDSIVQLGHLPWGPEMKEVTLQVVQGKEFIKKIQLVTLYL
jgi:hypothetical protein